MIVIKLDEGKTNYRFRQVNLPKSVSRQAFYDYLDRKDKPWKYAPLVAEMLKIMSEDNITTAMAESVCIWLC